MGLKIKAPATVTVDHVNKDGVSQSSEESIPVDVPAGRDLSKVKLSMGMTVNLGNYESARFDVGVEHPCSAEDIDAAYKTAQAWCDSKLSDFVSEVRGGS